MDWHHLFIPHKHTHHKAKLLTWQALLCYLLIFITLQSGMTFIGYAQPGVLGTTSSISKNQIIELTNAQRAQNGLPSLVENEALNRAAAAKAANMFEENYWAHFSPSGKDPWGFILSAGYKFTVAGENLAKNFSESNSVVVAWMNSPSHKENIVNSKYREIGIAVEDGVLEGQQTTLVVQMFGTSEVPVQIASARETNSSPNPPVPTSAPTATPQAIAQVINSPQPSSVVINVGGEKFIIPPDEYNVLPDQRLIALANNPPIKNVPLFDPFVVSRVVGISLLGMISLLLMIDFMVLRARGVFRFSSHHFAHLSLIFVATVGLLLLTKGNIL